MARSDRRPLPREGQAGQGQGIRTPSTTGRSASIFRSALPSCCMEDGQMDAAKRIIVRAQSDVRAAISPRAYSRDHLDAGGGRQGPTTPDCWPISTRGSTGEQAADRPSDPHRLARRATLRRPDRPLIPAAHGSDRSPVKSPRSSTEDRSPHIAPWPKATAGSTSTDARRPADRLRPAGRRGPTDRQAVRTTRGWHGLGRHQGHSPAPMGRFLRGHCRRATWTASCTWARTASGFQVFDPKTETWKSYGPEQGLPSRRRGRVLSHRRPRALLQLEPHPLHAQPGRRRRHARAPRGSAELGTRTGASSWNLLLGLAQRPAGRGGRRGWACGTTC